MISYKDRVFCVSKDCTNKCGRKLTDEAREAANALNLHICVGLFCEGVGEPITVNKVLSAITSFPNLEKSNE